MPSSLIEDENGMCAWANFRGNLIEMQLHGLAIASRQDQGRTGALFRANRTEQIGRLGPLIMDGAWS